MATVGSLLVVLRADTSPFSRSFKGAEDIVGKFGTSLVTKIAGATAIGATLDKTFDGIADALDRIRSGSNVFEEMTRASEALSEALKNVPVAGGLGRIIAGTWIDRLFGSPMAIEALKARKRAGEGTDPTAAQTLDALRANSKRIVESTATAYEVYAQKVGILDEALRRSQVTQEQYNETIKRLRAELPVFQEQAQLLEALRQRGAQVFASTRTPLENYRSAIEDLNNLVLEGFINWETYSRAVGQAMEVLRRSVGTKKQLESNLVSVGGGNGFGGLGIRDTSAFSGRNVIDRSQDQVANNGKKQLDLTAKQLEELKKINQTIQRGPLGNLIIEEVNL